MSIKETNFPEEIEEIRKLLSGLSTQEEVKGAFDGYVSDKYGWTEPTDPSCLAYIKELRKNPSMLKLFIFMGI